VAGASLKVKVTATFGRLTVLEAVRNAEGGRAWKCLCSCGTIVPAIETYSLSSGDTRSCGCLQRETLGNLRRKRPYEHLYNILRAKAERDGQGVTLSFEEFLVFVDSQECHYCGRQLVWTKFSTQNGVIAKTTATNLDRKDSQRGYDRLNLAPCCPPCNRGKSSQFSYEEWCVMASALRAYWKRP